MKACWFVQVSKIEFVLRGCLHDTGANFIQVRVHSGSLSWLCIRLHDTSPNSHKGGSHTSASSPRTVPEQDFHSGTKTRSYVM